MTNVWKMEINGCFCVRKGLARCIFASSSHKTLYYALFHARKWKLMKNSQFVFLPKITEIFGIFSAILRLLFVAKMTVRKYKKRDLAVKIIYLGILEQTIKEKSIDILNKNTSKLHFWDMVLRYKGKFKLTKIVRFSRALKLLQKPIFRELSGRRKWRYIFMVEIHGKLSKVNFVSPWQITLFMVLYTSNFRVYCAKFLNNHFSSGDAVSVAGWKFVCDRWSSSPGGRLPILFMIMLQQLLLARRSLRAFARSASEVHAAPLVIPPCNTVFPEVFQRIVSELCGNAAMRCCLARCVRCYWRKHLPFTGWG